MFFAILALFLGFHVYLFFAILEGLTGLGNLFFSFSGFGVESRDFGLFFRCLRQVTEPTPVFRGAYGKEKSRDFEFEEQSEVFAILVLKSAFFRSGRQVFAILGRFLVIFGRFWSWILVLNRISFEIWQGGPFGPEFWSGFDQVGILADPVKFLMKFDRGLGFGPIISVLGPKNFARRRSGRIFFGGSSDRGERCRLVVTATVLGSKIRPHKAAEFYWLILGPWVKGIVDSQSRVFNFGRGTLASLACEFVRQESDELAPRPKLKTSNTSEHKVQMCKRASRASWIFNFGV